MDTVIRRYVLSPPFPLTRRTSALVMPRGASVIKAHFLSDEGVCIWAETSSDFMVKRVFAIIGDGWTWERPPAAVYVDTVFVDDETLFHIYDLGEPDERDA